MWKKNHNFQPKERNCFHTVQAGKFLILPTLLVIVLIIQGCPGKTEDIVIFDFYENVPIAEMETQRRDSREPKRWPLNLQMDMRDFINQPSNTRLTWYVTIPADSSLRFGVGMDMISWQRSRGVTLSIIVTPDEGESQKIFSLFVNPQMNKDQTGWIDRKISLKQFANQLVRIEFLSQSYRNPEDDARIGWSRPLLTQRRSEMAFRTASRWDYNWQRAGDPVYWFITDSLPSQRLGAYGCPDVRTPWIDRFSRSSVQLQGCVPPSLHHFRSIGAMVTGQFSISNGLTQKNRSYHTGVRTVATTLRKSPHAYSSIVLTDSRMTTDPFALVPDASENYYIPPDYECDPWLRNNSLLDMFSRKLGQLVKGTHLVIVVMSDPAPASADPDRNWGHSKKNGGSVSRENCGVSGQTDSMLHNAMPGECVPGDMFFGRCLREVRRAEKGNEGVIIFSSLPSKSNREELQPQGSYSSTALENISTALLFSMPRLSRRHQIIEGYASGLDIVPTILDYLGIKAEEPCDGKSLLPALFSKTLSVTAYPAFFDHLPGKASMLSWPYKIDFNKKGKDVKYTIFDVANDPHEQQAIPMDSDFHRRELCQQFRANLIFRLDVEKDRREKDRHSSRWFAH